MLFIAIAWIIRILPRIWKWRTGGYLRKQSYEEFKHFIEADDIAWEQTRQKIAALEPMIDTVIFGIGNMGFLVNCYLEQNDMPTVVGIDNASWKWNQELNGLLILSSEEGVKRYPNAVYIIANAAHGQEMKDILVSKIKEGNYD